MIRPMLTANGRLQKSVLFFPLLGSFDPCFSVKRRRYSRYIDVKLRRSEVISPTSGFVCRSRESRPLASAAFHHSISFHHGHSDRSAALQLSTNSLIVRSITRST